MPVSVALAQADGGEVAEDSNGDDDHNGDEWNVQPTVTPAKAGRFGGKTATIFKQAPAGQLVPTARRRVEEGFKVTDTGTPSRVLGV